MIYSREVFFKNGDKVELRGPVFLSCGCGGITAKWASVQQNLSTRVQQVRLKANKLAYQFVEQEGLKEKIPELKLHQFGVVIAWTENGIESVNITTGASPNVATKISVLLKRNKEYEQRNNQPA